jgi:Tfp pilus assembly protein PilN
MNFPVNMATKPMETRRFFLTVCGFLIALFALPFPWLVWHVHSVRKSYSTFQVHNQMSAKEIGSLIKEREELVRFFSEPENAKLHDRAAFINSIIEGQSLNWTRMFLALERVLPGGVRVLNIEPKLENGQAAVKLTVGAISEESKRNFLSALEQSGDFSKVELSNVRMSSQSTAGDPIVMELQVKYAGGL